MIGEWELFAVAEYVHKHHGERAPVFIAERVGACAIADDAAGDVTAGVETWKAIAARYEALRTPLSAD